MLASVPQDSILGALAMLGAARLCNQNELACDAARRSEERPSLGRPQVIVELTAEHALERRVCERERQRLRVDLLSARQVGRSDRQHVGAGIKEGQLAPQAPGEKPGATGHVHSPRCCRS